MVCGGIPGLGDAVSCIARSLGVAILRQARARLLLAERGLAVGHGLIDDRGRCLRRRDIILASWVIVIVGDACLFTVTDEVFELLHGRHDGLTVAAGKRQRVKKRIKG
jgi:hypothetical protein